MLFHAIHRHTHETCSAHKPDNQAQFEKAFKSADEIGIDIIGMYVDAPGHSTYFILEADSSLQIAKFFDPILELGDTEIKPVSDATKLLEQLRQEQQ